MKNRTKIAVLGVIFPETAKFINDYLYDVLIAYTDGNIYLQSSIGP